MACDNIISACLPPELGSMTKEGILTDLFKKELPIRHYPESRIYACTIPKRFRDDNPDLPSRVTHSTRDGVVDKLFDSLIKGGLMPSYGRNTLTGVYEDWIRERENDPDVSPQTVRKNKGDWEKFFKDTVLARTPLRLITAKDLYDHFKAMTVGRQLSKHAFRNARTVMNALFDRAYQQGLIEINVCKDLNTSKLKFKPDKNTAYMTYTREEREILCDHLEKSDNLYDKLIVFMFCTGCRVSEAKGVMWCDIDFDKKQVYIHRMIDNEGVLQEFTKSGLSEGNRIIPLSDRLIRLLMSIPRPENKETLVFTRDYLGAPLRTQTVDDHLRQTCRDLGINYLSTHKIRATMITMWLADGADQATVMYVAGHKDPQTMRHYVRVQRINSDVSAHFANVCN